MPSSTPEAGELEQLVAQAMNGPNTELPTRIRAAILSYSQAEAARARIAEERLQDSRNILERREQELIEQCDRLRSMAEATTAALDAAKREVEILTDMNHGQFLEIEYLRPIFNAARDLYDQSEEYESDEGMGSGAPQDYWDQLAGSFEPATEAIQEVIDAAALAAKSTEPKEG